MSTLFFHLLTHAMFKSLLFLCAGVFIHSIGDLQDIRSMGGLIISCPVTSFYFICSSMALCGFPFLSGFYSKDIILELFFLSKINIFMFGVIFFSTLFTLSYSVRLLFYVFFNNTGRRTFINLAEESGMTTPMSLLVVFSLAAGSWISAYFFPLNFIFLPIVLKLRVIVGLGLVFVGFFVSLLGKKYSGAKLTSNIIFFFGSM